MTVICIECSHKRGMGHFYRALNILHYFGKIGETAVVVINHDKIAVQLLKNGAVPYETVDYTDIISNWEKNIIHKYQADVWLLDKFETRAELAWHVKNEGVVLAAIDDCGEGAEIGRAHV